jgi:hypothetical protein
MLSTERRIGKADGKLAVKVSTVALKQGVLLYRDLHIEVTVGTARRPCLSLSAKTNAIAGIDPRWHLNGQRLRFLNKSFSMTNIAWGFDDFSATTTGGTGLLHLKEPLLHTNLAGATAGTTGFD